VKAFDVPSTDFPIIAKRSEEIPAIAPDGVAEIASLRPQ
jgi:hypothetical protein